MKKLLFVLLFVLSCAPPLPKTLDTRIFCIWGPYWSGTGFNVKAPSGKTYIVTNKHVCATEGSLTTYTGSRMVLHAVVRVYDKADLCVLSTGQDKSFILADRYVKDQKVKVTGYPHRIRKTLRGTLGGVVYVKVGDAPENTYLIFYDLAVQPGNSGSPVLNSKGAVIGVISAGNGFQSLAVPLEYLVEALRGL